MRRAQAVEGVSSLKKLSTELAPRHGFEPRFTAPKAAVLPLDDRGGAVDTANLQNNMQALQSRLLHATGRTLPVGDRRPIQTVFVRSAMHVENAGRLAAPANGRVFHD